MKKNILRISILPGILLMALSFTGLPPQKDNNKGNKGNNERGQGNQNDRERGNNGNNNENKSSRGNQNNDGGRSENDQGNKGNGRSDNGNRGDDNNQKNKNNDKSRESEYDNDDNRGMGKNKNGKGDDMDKGNGKWRRETIKWHRDENILWGFDNYSSRKRPKDYKKVTVCHNTGDSNYPVTITVSENALQAHLNHGDQTGSCTVNYSDRWPVNFIRTRENVYNSYENTWETMSYSEALLRYAAEKLLGVRSTFQAQRPTLTSQEVQRRETLILELQNNVNSLENQLAVSRQRMDGVNININL